MMDWSSRFEHRIGDLDHAIVSFSVFRPVASQWPCLAFDKAPVTRENRMDLVCVKACPFNISQGIFAPNLLQMMVWPHEFESTSKLVYVLTELFRMLGIVDALSHIIISEPFLEVARQRKWFLAFEPFQWQTHCFMLCKGTDGLPIAVTREVWSKHNACVYVYATCACTSMIFAQVVRHFVMHNGCMQAYRHAGIHTYIQALLKMCDYITSLVSFHITGRASLCLLRSSPSMIWTKASLRVAGRWRYQNRSCHAFISMYQVACSMYISPLHVRCIKLFVESVFDVSIPLSGCFNYVTHSFLRMFDFVC
jgi:hypothetical protein